LKALPPLVALAATTTCIPPLGPDDSLVSSTRILAIRADPAEAPPGTQVTFRPLVADADGTVARPDIVWTFCTAPRQLTDENAVSNLCLGWSALVGATLGPSPTLVTPSDGCSLFGPDVGAAGLRPRDADGTGGYDQPLRADLPGADTAFDLVRIHCDLANAAATDAAAFATQYRLNQNPSLLPLTATRSGSPWPLTAVPPGARLTLEASWPAVSAETFAYFDPVSQTVTQQREAMQVAWYSSAGALDSESTGRASDDTATTTDDGWLAPSVPGSVHLWIVLRDSRGGVDFASYDIAVAP
jgi:hypothetical protein